jgi:hypothetical protein
VERHVIEVIERWLDGFGELDAGAAGAVAAMCILAAFVPVPRTIPVLGPGLLLGLRRCW